MVEGDSSPTLGIQTPAANRPARRLAIPSAAPTVPELLDLASIGADLLTAEMAAHHINAPEIQASEFVYLRHACWEGAIVAYGRCFADGKSPAGLKRKRLNGFLKYLTPVQRKTHDTILEYRNKRVGHHEARHSGQDIAVYAGVQMADPATGFPYKLDNLYVDINSSVYDIELLTELSEITLALRVKVFERIDELRYNILDQMNADAANVIDAIRHRRAWP